MNIALTDNRQARVPYDDLREWIVEADKLGELIRAPWQSIWESQFGRPPIFRTIWSTNWSKQFLRTCRAL